MGHDVVVTGAERGEQDLYEQAGRAVHEISAQGLEAFHGLMSEAGHEGMSDEEIKGYEDELTAVQAELRAALTQYEEELQQLGVERDSKRKLAEMLKSPSAEKMLQTAEEKLGTMRERVVQAQKTERVVGEVAKKGSETRGRRVSERAQKEKNDKELAIKTERFIPSLEAAGIGISEIVGAVRALNPGFVDNFVDAKIGGIDEYKESLPADKQSELSELLLSAEMQKQQAEQHFIPSAGLKEQVDGSVEARKALEAAKDSKGVNAEDYKVLNGEIKALELAAAEAVQTAKDEFVMSKHGELDLQHSAALREFVVRESGHEAIKDSLSSGEIDIEALTNQVVKGIKPEKFTLRMYENLSPEMIQAIVDNIPEASFVRGDLLKSGLPARTFDTLKNPLVATDAFLRRQRAAIDTYRQDARNFGDENQKLSQGLRPDSHDFEYNKKYFCDRTRRQLELFKGLCDKQGVSSDEVEQMITREFERAGIEHSDFDDDDKIMEKQQKISRVMFGLGELGWRRHGEAPKGELMRLGAVTEGFSSIEHMMKGAEGERAKIKDALKISNAEVASYERQLAMLPQAWEEGSKLEDEQVKIVDEFGARNNEMSRRMQQAGSAQELREIANETMQLQADLTARLKPFNALQLSYNTKVNELQYLRTAIDSGYENAFRATNGSESGAVEKDKLEKLKLIKDKHNELRKNTPHILSTSYGRSEVQHYNGQPIQELTVRIAGTFSEAKRREGDMHNQDAQRMQKEAAQKSYALSELRGKMGEIRSQRGRDVSVFNNIMYGIKDDLKLIEDIMENNDKAEKKLGFLTKSVMAKTFRRNGTGLAYGEDQKMTREGFETQKMLLDQHKKTLVQRGASARAAFEESLSTARRTAGNVFEGIERINGRDAAGNELVAWRAEEDHYKTSLKWYDDNLKVLLEAGE